MMDQLYDDYAAFVDAELEELRALWEEFDYYNDQPCEFDQESE